MELKYRKTRTYEITGFSCWNSYLYENKGKALAKLSELMDKCQREMDFVIKVNPNGQIVEDFDEDLQMSKSIADSVKKGKI